MARSKTLYVLLVIIAFTAMFQNCGDFAPEDLNSSLEGGPTPTIGSSAASPTTETPIPMVVNFNQNIIGMSLSLIQVTNGVAENFKTVSEGRSYSFDITPTNWGDVIVYIPPRAVKDGLGKESMPSNTFSIIYGSATSNRFAVSVTDTRKYPFYYNKNGSPFGTPCAIQAQSNERDVLCTLDIPEGDLYFTGLEFEYQAPPGMCRYLQYDNYSYYNFETGIGPQNIRVFVNRNGTPHPGCGATNAAFCFRVDNNATIFTTTANAPANLEISDFDKESLAPKCRYDYTASEGPNCCLGGYTLQTNVIGLKANATAPDPANVVTNMPMAKWGGSFAGCMAGPAADDSSWPKTKDGFPIAKIQYAASGILEKYLITPPIKLYSSSNVSAANYFSPGNLANNTGLHYHTGRTFTNIESASPIAIDPIDDRFVSNPANQAYYPSGERLPDTSGFYSFSCLDEAWEVKHRIRVQIREWNTYAAFLTYGT